MLPVLLLTIAIVAAALLALRGRGPHKRCPACDVAYIQVPSLDGEHRPYDVLICPVCTNTVTRVHGARSNMAYCPTCSNRSLETPCARSAHGADAPTRVAVHEYCHICGHEDEVVFGPPEETRPLGRVIPFPRPPPVQEPRRTKPD